MPAIMSMEDLQKMRAELLKMRRAEIASGSVRIAVSMGTPAIAAGSRDTLQEIRRIIEERHLPDITIIQVGSIGLDSWEPVVRVFIDNQPPVTYGRVTPSVADRILVQHVIGGKVVSDCVVLS